MPGNPGNPANHYPGPWRFYAHRFGFQHVITDRDGRYIVSGVPIGCGPLLAAGPQLLDALERIADVAPPRSPAHELGRRRIGIVPRARGDGAGRLAPESAGAAVAHCRRGVVTIGRISDQDFARALREAIQAAEWMVASASDGASALRVLDTAVGHGR